MQIRLTGRSRPARLERRGGAVCRASKVPFAVSGLFIPSSLAANIGWSLAVVAGCIGTRLVAEWIAVRRADSVTARQRRFTIRALANAILVFALLAIWMAEIQNLVLSLTAVVVAMVIATKELIMCAAGSMLRMGGHLFKVGDRIEMSGIHGEVLDHGLFSTTIMELPSHHLGHRGTGRTVMLPNSVLLTMPVRLEAQPRHYAPHRFTLTLEEAADLGRVLRKVDSLASAALAEDLDRATRFHRLATAKGGPDVAGPGHEVSITTTDLGKVQLHIMIYCLVKDARRLEQEIILRTLEEVSMAKRRAEDKGWDDVARKLQPQARGHREAA